MKFKFSLLTLILLFAVAGNVFAKGGGGKKGPEVTMDNGKLRNFAVFYEIKNRSIGRLVSTKYHVEARDRFKNEVKKLCGRDCRYEQIFDPKYPTVMNWKISHKLYSFFTFYITCDPRVIEVKMDPMTTQQILMVKNEMQRLIWDASENAKLSTKNDPGNGHIHLDIRSHFGDPDKKGDAVLFRNFFVDMQNHPEVYNYIFGNSGAAVYNAPSLAYHGTKSVEAFKKVINHFDKHPKQKTMRGLAQNINNKVYNPTTSKGEKYQMVNLVRLDYEKYQGNETLEIRAFKSQRSADEYIKILLLLDARIDYLNTLDTLIPYEGKVFNLRKTFGKKFDQDVIDSFYEYVTKPGLNFDDYKYFIPKRMKKITPTELR